MLISETIHQFFSMFVAPRRTIRQIVDSHPTDPGKNIAALVFTSMMLGIVSGFLSEGHAHPSLELGMAIFLGLFVAWGWLYFTSWAVRATGKWLNGEGNFAEIMAANAWSLAPVIVSNLLQVVLLLVVQPYVALLGNEKAMLPLWVEAIRWTILGLSLGLFVWFVVISSMAIAEVQKFKSNFKGFWNGALPWMILSVAVLIFIVGVTTVVFMLRSNGAI